MMSSLLTSLSGVWFDTADISAAEMSPHSVFIMIAAAFVFICGLLYGHHNRLWSLPSLWCDGRRPICCKLTMYYVQCWPTRRVLPKQRPKEPADAETCQTCRPSLWRLTIVRLEEFVFTPTGVLVIYIILVGAKAKAFGDLWTRHHINLWSN